MTIESRQLNYPLFTVKSTTKTIDSSTEIGAYLDVANGEYLGLLFSSRDMAKQFIYRKVPEATAKNNDVYEISSQSQLVQLARRVKKENVIEVFVLDYSLRGETAVAIPVEELCRIEIPEDTDTYRT